MKKLLAVIVIAIITTVITECNLKKEEEPKKLINFSARIDGVLYEEGAHYTKNIDGTGPYKINSNFITFNGKKRVGFSISLWCDEVGTYIVRDTTRECCNVYYSENPEILTGHYGAVSGSVTVTKFDSFNKTFSGTFDLIVQDGWTGERRKITEGKFTDVANLYK